MEIFNKSGFFLKFDVFIIIVKEFWEVENLCNILWKLNLFILKYIFYVNSRISFNNFIFLLMFDN